MATTKTYPITKHTPEEHEVISVVPTIETFEAGLMQHAVV